MIDGWICDGCDEGVLRDQVALFPLTEVDDGGCLCLRCAHKFYDAIRPEPTFELIRARFDRCMAGDDRG